MATVLKLGSQGADVQNLQHQLKSLGYTVSVDGVFGASTDTAVKALQRQYRLKDDGVVGEKTWAVLNTPNKTLKRLTEADFQWAAEFLGDDVPSVKAVNAVEAPKGGFLPDGRATILFERHVMFRRLKEHQVDPTPFTVSDPDIVNKKSGGYQGYAKEYVRLTRAQQIHPAAALESCSWGAYQIMGYHWKLLGYASVFEFVERMQQGEREQLEAFVRFIKSQPALLKAIREDNWKDFARWYNGVNYSANQYDIKLETAFKQFSALAKT